MNVRTAAAAASVLLLLAGCAGMSSSNSNGGPATASAEPGDETSEEPSEEPTDEPVDDGPSEGSGGSALSFHASEGSENEGAEGTIRVSQPTKAKCQYSFGCDKPENGAVYTVVVTVKSTGTVSFPVNPFDFSWETADGEQYDAFDGSAFDYMPDNAMNDKKVRTGSTYRSTLTFDVPKRLNGASLLWAPNYDSDPLGVWSFG